MTARHVALVGMMGSGKTTVGRLLAARLGRPLVDTDDLVARDAGRSVAEVFATEGEAGFRARERAALVEACGPGPPRVVACGGGVVLDAANRARLAADAFVVWLRARPATLAARVGDGAGRPLLAGPPGAVRERLATLAAGREDRYREVADAVVDTDDREPAEIADEIARLAGAAHGTGGR